MFSFINHLIHFLENIWYPSAGSVHFQHASEKWVPARPEGDPCLFLLLDPPTPRTNDLRSLPQLDVSPAALKLCGRRQRHVKGLGNEIYENEWNGYGLPKPWKTRLQSSFIAFPLKWSLTFEENGRQLLSISTKDQPGGNGLESQHQGFRTPESISWLLRNVKHQEMLPTGLEESSSLGKLKNRRFFWAVLNDLKSLPHTWHWGRKRYSHIIFSWVSFGFRN